MDEATHKGGADAAREARPRLSSVPNLTESMRRARLEAAEQAQVVADLRHGEIARLEMLAEAVRPVLAQAPKGVDLFDLGVTAGERPRLFVDMIGFVEMARDRRTYQFLQDTRHGRLTLAQSERVDDMAQAIADYAARRLIEREKALAADMTVEEAADRLLRSRAAAAGPATATPDAKLPPATGLAVAPAPVASAATPAVERAPAAPRRGLFEAALLFVIQFLGAAALTLLVAAACWQLWRLVAGVDN